MDYLDLKKQARHRVILFVGYILIGVALTTATIILVNQAYGFGIAKNGNLIQNGLVFFSSQPNPAQISLNGKPNPSPTNTRLYIPAGIYKAVLSRAGYDDWQRLIDLNGGSVEHFDYPFLFPKTFTTNKQQTYASAPALMTQSPDRRWLLVTKPGGFDNFDVYDLKSASKNNKVTETSFSLPDNLLTKASSTEHLQVSEWADDNQHILLQHDYDGKTEFILVDRTTPSLSANLNSSLNISPTKVTLKNKKYNQFYFYNSTDKSLQTASLQTLVKTPVEQHVLAYQSYGNDSLLYVTDNGAPAGKVLLRMTASGQTYNLHSFPASPNYVVDLTEYSGTMYVAAGASSSSKVYIYKDPLGQLSNSPNQAVSPIQVLRIDQPNYLSFSDNAQFIVAENGGQFGVYDIENQKGYAYNVAAPDPPMVHAEWMDGNRLNYVSSGKLTVFDYDQTNRHALVSASSSYIPAFAPNYKYFYDLSTNAAGQYQLNQTWLLAAADR